ncbi:phosphonate metabolism protein/1,5-bisphosphokinase (PRPP-forming) PhnN [Limobrevibacterium gyesilva]|uniref:Ribose 1,5-bisphosphate phosphokinase PhnN n=1 Tax=Limobrevibacterium gyesilva TaxID=2991712 RepID=A0AA41YKZ2_9PROT|nr:phosphonate metabolism protein/1,5-bisphosphokinase (PRPP-forming) PhnN [Limobrevibacterium gyesilva]MCW3475769.1 phosphonate metabolism protein/1,5-bisphosphokinase (PRPP-forming) PhnN [Limobrevibacterium gyesilva]
MLILVVGPSGAGKDTLMEAARRRLAGDARFRFVRREITRPREAGGEDHVPVDAAGFARRRAAGAYALSWEAHGLGYGIPADIADALAAGRVVVANVSRAVIADAARRFPVRVLEITAPPEVLARRLAARGREDAQDVAARLRRSVSLPQGVDVVTVMNDGTVEEGAGRVLAALTRATESARPA